MANVKVTELSALLSADAADSDVVMIVNVDADTSNKMLVSELRSLITNALVIGVDVQAYSAILDATTASYTTALDTKLDGIEANADVTDADNVNSSGAVMESDYTPAFSLLVQQSGTGSPGSLSVATGTIVGRTTSGGSEIDDLSPTQVRLLLNVEDGADVTDTTNVTNAGALMDSEVTNLAQVKAFDSADYATAAQGTTADNALPTTGGTLTGDLTIVDTTSGSAAGPELTLTRDITGADGNYLGQLRFLGNNDIDQSNVYAKITAKISDATDTTEDGLIEFALRKDGSNAIVGRLTSTDLKLINGTGLEVDGDIIASGTVDGRDVATDGAKLDGIEALADVTDATNIAAAGGVIPTGTPDGTKFLRDDEVWTTIPGGGDALTSNPLSQFASTTSLQLLGVISDETGTGALVFGTSPTLVTPNLGTPTTVWW